MMEVIVSSIKGADHVIKSLAVICAALAPLPALSDTYLLMAEEDGCYWCAKWNEEIAHIYPKTAEGRTAPLRRYDVHDQPPDVTFVRRVHYTPTFILVEDAQEVGRIEGYPGQDFFWGLLGELFKRAEIPLVEAS